MLKFHERNLAIVLDDGTILATINNAARHFNSKTFYHILQAISADAPEDSTIIEVSEEMPVLADVPDTTPDSTDASI